ncbi:PanC Panthothenate synthetase [Candidatus Nanopelagicaceae bacterium]
MKIAVNAKELIVDGACAFVPTMGALHAGHASLIKKAREYSDTVVVSIFINPLQFENKDDLAKYPRTPEFDIELASQAGATHVWLPTVDEIYPGEVQKISAGPLGDMYEGVNRPGHFDGVLTVVNRLFELVKPQWAIFGEKDFQQLTLIKSMKSDVEIIAAPTIRDSDGLALSSRNVRLSDSKAALVIYRALISASKEIDIDSAREVMQGVLASEAAFTLDYAEIINESNFEKAVQSDGRKRAIIAGWVNGIRLIDNMPMNGGAQ